MKPLRIASIALASSLSLWGCGTILGLEETTISPERDAGPEGGDAESDVGESGEEADVSSAGDSSAEADSQAEADSPSEADSEVDSGPFDPLSLGGLALWLDAASGVELQQDADAAALVSKWKDQSGKGNDALPGTWPAPEYRASGLNARPSVHFCDGTRLQIPDDGSSLQFGIGSFLISVILEHSTPMQDTPDGALIISKTDPLVSPFAGFGLYANWPQKKSGDSLIGFQVSFFKEVVQPYPIDQNGVTKGVPVLVTGMRHGNELFLRLNGVQVASSVEFTATNVSAPGKLTRIGSGESHTFQGLCGDIGEIVAVKGEMTEAEVGKLESWLLAKYGLQATP